MADHATPVLVTGSDGFIGGHLLRSIRGATADPDARVKAVLHQAANNDTLERDECSIMAANVDYTRRLFQRHLEQGCEVFVFASSTAVYGNGQAPFKETQPPAPLNHYARSKLAMEEWVFDWAKSKGVRAVGLRYCNVYGPGECHKGRRASTIHHLLRQVIFDGRSPSIFKDGTQKRDWVSVYDVVQANELALLRGEGVYNVGNGTATTFNDIARWVLDSAGSSYGIKYIDMPADMDPVQYQSYTECDLTKIRSELGYEPAMSVQRGIGNYAKWLRHKYHVGPAHPAGWSPGIPTAFSD